MRGNESFKCDTMIVSGAVEKRPILFRFGVGGVGITVHWPEYSPKGASLCGAFSNA